MTDYDIAIIGGGLVGSAIAYGLARAGYRVAVLDEGDVAHRASRGNFGLVWVQGKGIGMPAYAHWSRSSADRWAAFAGELSEVTGIDVQHRRPGGLHLCLGEDEYEAREAALAGLVRETNGRFRYRMLDHEALARRLPGISPAVTGASWSDLDGHANPLYLLRALHAGLVHHGGRYLSGAPVERVRPIAGGFRIENGAAPLEAGRVVLAAGLGSRALAPQVGLDAPLLPSRGQILVTERTVPLLDGPTTYMRQTGEGSILLGDSHEDVGFDDGTRTEVLAEIARRAVTAFPRLRSVRVVRGWGALRVMTPDGLPLYEQSRECPGAFVAACHSGVTLAAAHAERLAPWIAGETAPADIHPFTAERFHVQTAA